MIGRVNILEADPSRIDGGIAFVRDHVQPVVDAEPGSRGLGMWVDRETGEVVVTTVWEDRAALEASESGVAELRAEAARVLGAAGVRVELAESEVVWQADADQPGYWSRAVEMDVPPSRIAEAIALFRDEVLRKVQDIPGVNTIVFLVNRDTGHTMLTVTYRSRAELLASRETAAAMRAGVVGRLGAGEPMVHELETVIVGIRGAVIDLDAVQSRTEV
ncbi:MAG: antibiotic biosynthesis monooxygenase [Motilibacteraceae bacterium]